MASTGGHLLTLEINEERAKLAQQNFHAAGVEPYVTIDRVDALEEIPKLTGPYDFVFIDAWRPVYMCNINWHIIFTFHIEYTREYAIDFNHN